MRYLFFIITLSIFSLQYKLWLGDSSILAWNAVQEKSSMQKNINNQIQSENQNLRNNIYALKHSSDAIEEEARQNFGMIKNNEIYYQFIE